MLRSRLWLGVGFTLLCGAVLFGLHASNQVNGDEGIILNGAWNIVNGRKLYVDFFEFIPPGAFYFVAAPWSVFGVNYWLSKVLAVAMIAAGALGVTAAARLVAASAAIMVPAAWLLATSLVFCLLSASWAPINHNTVNIALLVWATYFALRCLIRGAPRDSLWAGLLSGIAACVLLHRSAALVAAFAAVLAWRLLRSRSTADAQALGGFLLSACLLPLALLLFWQPGLLYDSLIVFPATRYVEVNRVDYSLFWLLAAVAASTAWALRRARSDSVIFLLLLQALLGLSALQRTSLTYITLAVFPLVILSPLLASRASQRGDSASAPMTLSGRMLMYASLVFLLMLAAPGVLKIATKPSLVEDRAAESRSLQYIREHCGLDRFMYAGPFLPGLYFEARKLNPTRFSILLTNFSRDEQFSDARSALQADPPRCIVTGYSMMDEFGHRTENPVDEFIAAAYSVVLEERTLKVWRLNAGR